MKGIFQKLTNLVIAPLEKSFRRFPEAIINAFVLGILMVIQNELDQPAVWLQDLTRALFLTLPLMIILRLMLQRWSLLNRFQWILFATMFTIGGLFFLFLTLESAPGVEFNRFANLGFAFYLLVVFLPYLWDRQGINIGIIYFFTKLFTALFYSLVLFLGIFVVLISINVLFELSIELTLYTNILIIIMTFVFVPTLLDAYPLGKKEFTIKKDYSIVWQRVFSLIVGPVIAVFSALIIIYLITGLFQSTTYVADVYTFSALVIAFVGISAQVALTPIQTNGFSRWFVKYFHFPLIVVMLGYYVEQFITISLHGISLGVVIQLILGLWPFTYAIFVILKDKAAVHRGLLALTGAFLMIAAFPGLNAVSLTTFLLNAEFRQTLRTNEMLGENNTIIRQEVLSDDTYMKLMDTLDRMEVLGFHRFSLVPQGYLHPAQFETIFGGSDGNPFEPDVESLYFNLNSVVFDLTGLPYVSLLYLHVDATTPFTTYQGQEVTIDFSRGLQDQYPLTITYQNQTETIGLYEQVAQSLKTRYQDEPDRTFTNPEDLLVSLTLTHFDVDIWVSFCSLTRSNTYKDFVMSFYLGIKLK